MTQSRQAATPETTIPRITSFAAPPTLITASPAIARSKMRKPNLTRALENIGPNKAIAARPPFERARNDASPRLNRTRMSETIRQVARRPMLQSQRQSCQARRESRNR
eukprot:9482744-Pyramimonas_sp.AAC.1